MITLNGSTESLVAVLSGSVNVDYTSSSELVTSPGTATPAVKQGQITDTTVTAVVSAPADGVFAKVRFLSLRNVGSANVSVSVKKKVSSSYYQVTPAISLNAGESVEYTEDQGFVVLDSAGCRKNAQLSTPPQPAIRYPVNGRTAATSATKALTGTSAATNVYAYYVGKASRAVSSVVVKVNVTTAATATIASLEVALATGAPGALTGTTSTLTVVGYADASAVYNATGLKTVTVNVSSGYSINAGDDVWILFSSATSGTAPILTAFDAADILLSNVTGVISGANSAVRPSTVLLGVPTAFTTEANNVLSVWCAVSGL